MLWQTASLQPKRRHFYVAMGSSADSLGRPQVLRMGDYAARGYGAAQLLAAPDGGFAICFSESRDERRGQSVAGCTFAPPSGRFGPLRVIARRPASQSPSTWAVMRADGRLVIALSRAASKRRRITAVTTMDSAGQLGPLRSLTTLGGSFDGVGLASLTDGTVAAGWSEGGTGDYDSQSKPVLRLMPPGSDEFGPPVRFSADETVHGGPYLTGGAALLIDYSVGPDLDTTDDLVVQRLPDGSFSTPQRLPRPGPGYLSGSAVSLPDGTPLAVTAAEEQSETDCGNVSSGSVGVGPLVESSEPVTATRLSATGQIALYPGIATLSDGTAIAQWGNSFGQLGQTRLETAIRPAGSPTFEAPQVLPKIAARDVTLAGGGDQAILVWVVGSIPDGPNHLVASALRRGGPYAPMSRRPSRPQAPCS